LGVGTAAERAMARLEPIIDAGTGEPGLREMVRHDFRLARSDVGKPLLERARNLRMQLVPPALEQGLIGCVAHQRMLEAVDGVPRLAAAEHEFRQLKLGERTL